MKTLLIVAFCLVSVVAHGFGFGDTTAYVIQYGSTITTTLTNTICAWVFTTNACAGDNRIVYVNAGCEIWIRAGAAAIYGTAWNNASAVITNGWHHVAATRVFSTTGEYKLYVDGVLLISTARPYADGTAGALVLSARGNPAFIGSIADTRVYDRALTASEVAAIANAYPRGSDGITRGLLIRYNEESPARRQTGAILPDLSVIVDVSGNGKNGRVEYGTAASPFIAPSIISNRRAK